MGWDWGTRMAWWGSGGGIESRQGIAPRSVDFCSDVLFASYRAVLCGKDCARIVGRPKVTQGRL